MQEQGSAVDSIQRRKCMAPTVAGRDACLRALHVKFGHIERGIPPPGPAIRLPTLSCPCPVFSHLEADSRLQWLLREQSAVTCPRLYLNIFGTIVHIPIHGHLHRSSYASCFWMQCSTPYARRLFASKRGAHSNR